jgi:methanogenic corrinoid protein MtbC1
MADFASRLRELRRRRGLRQRDVAAALGLAQTTVANYEQNLRFPDEPTLVKIADLFSVSLDHLMGRENGGSVPSRPVGGATLAMGAPLPQRAQEYLDALRRGDTEAARRALRAARDAGSSIQDLYIGVIAPALEEVGRLWEIGELLVSEEHAISQATLQLMATLLPAHQPDPPPAGRTRCVVVTPGDESHVIGARMVADLLFLTGFTVEFFGGNLSIRNVLESLRRQPCALVAVSVTLREHLGAAEDMIRAIRADPSLACVKVIAGGQAFSGAGPGLAHIGADAQVTDAEEAVQAALALAKELRREA